MNSQRKYQSLGDASGNFVARESRAEGGLLGLLVGEYAGEHAAIGTIAQEALCVVESLSQWGKLVGRDVDARIRSRARVVSIRAAKASSSQSGKRVGRIYSHDAAGALIRTIPLALWVRGTPTRALQSMLRLAMVPDGPPYAACAQLGFWARMLYDGLPPEKAWLAALDLLSEVAGDFPNAMDKLLAGRRVLESSRQGEHPCFDLLLSARSLLLVASADFNVALECANTLAGSALATLVGALAGIHLGSEVIPRGIAASLDADNRAAGLLRAMRIRACETPRLYRLPERTSSSHPLQFGSLPLSGGTLVLTEAPGLKNRMICSDEGMQRIERNLVADLDRMREAGISALVTLMMPDEIIDADMTGLADACVQHGLEWFQLAVDPSGETDEFAERELTAMLPRLREFLGAGGQVALHAENWHDRLGAGALWIAKSIEPAAPILELRNRIAATLADGRRMTDTLDEIE